MAYFLLLLIFWKPIYYLVRYIIAKVQKKTDAEQYITSAKTWFGGLWNLISPTL